MPTTHKNKVCAQFGKSESKNWNRHWKRLHPNIQVKELQTGEVPQVPYDDSWVYLIEPLKLREQFTSPAKTQEVPPKYQEVPPKLDLQ